MRATFPLLNRSLTTSPLPRGHDLIPAKYSLSEEAIPKSAARVLNAAKVQAEYRAKKRSSEDDGSQGKAKRRKVDSSTSGMSIKPGESLTHFNKCVVVQYLWPSLYSPHRSSTHYHRTPTAWF